MPKICNIALVGRPNAGKSTLFNYLLYRKLGSVSPKANTTRASLLAIREEDGVEFQFTDTPGWDRRPKGSIEKILATFARSSILEAAVIIIVMDAARRIVGDDEILYRDVVAADKPYELVFTKSDRLTSKKDFELRSGMVREWGYKGKIWLVSGKSGAGIVELKQKLIEYSSEGQSLAAVGINKERFATECVREHAFRLLNQEVPYGLWVELSDMKEENGACTMNMYIKILHERHKPMVLGAHGQMIKRIGSRARAALMEAWNQRVHLFLTVKVGREDELMKSCR